MAVPSHALSRVARGLFKAALWVLLFFGVVIGAVYFVGRSSWGRQRILSIILPAVEKQLTGQLRIGALDGDLTHMLVLRDVELSDAEGQTAVRVPYLGLRYNLPALLGRTLHVTAVDIKGASVHARVLKDGRLNLAALTRPDNEPSPPSTGPLPLRILISGIRADLTASYDGAPADGPLAHAAASLRLAADFHLRPDRRMSVEVDALELDAGAPLAARLSLHGELSLSLLDAAQSLSVHGVALSLGTTGEQVTRLAPAALLKGPLALDANLEGGLAALSAKLRLKLPVGQADIGAKLGLVDDKLPWELQLDLRDFDPSALRQGLPSGQVALSLHGKGNGPSGQAELQNLSVHSGKTTLGLSGKLEAPAVPPIWQDPFGAQAELAISMDAGNLAELGKLGAPPLGGALAMTVHASFKQRVLALSAKAHGSGLRAPGVEVGRLELDLDSRDLAGKLRLAVDNLVAGGQRISQLALTAEGDRRLLRINLDGQGPEAVQLKLGAAVAPQLSGGAGPFELQGARLSGIVADLSELLLSRGAEHLSLSQPARLRVLDLQKEPIAEVDSLALELGALKLRLSGRFETQAQRLRASVAATNLDVQELVRIATGQAGVPKSALSLQAELGGTVSAPTGQLQLSGQVEPLPGMLPWRVFPQLSASLADRRVRGDLLLRTESAPKQSGQNTQNTQGSPPSVKAHFEVPLSPERAMLVNLDAQAALSSLRSFLPPPLLDLDGQVAAQVNLGGTLKQPQAEISVTLPSFKLAPVRGEQTSLHVTYKQEQLSAQILAQVLSLDGKPLGRGRIAAQVPLRLTPEVSGEQIVEQLRNGAGTVDLALSELALPQLIAVAQGPSAQVPLSAGSAAVTLQARGPLQSPTLNLHVDATGIRGLPQSGAPDAASEVDLRVQYQKDALGLTLKGSFDGKPLLAAQAGTTVRVAELLRDGAALVNKLPIHGDVEIFPTPLPPGLGVAGTLSAHAEAHGTPQALELSAKANARALSVGDWPVGDLTLRAALDAKRMLKAEASVMQGTPARPPLGSHSGTLSLVADLPLPLDLASPATQVVLLAKNYRFDYQALHGQSAAVRLVRGTLDSDLTVKGGMPQPLVTGGLSLKDGQILTAALPQLLSEIAVDLRARPDGVLYLERAFARAAQGRVDAQGSVQVTAGKLKNVELTSTINNFPIAAGSLGLWLDTKLQVAGHADDGTLRVKVNIPYGTLRLPRLTDGSDSDVQALGPLDDVRFVDAVARKAAAQAEAEAAEQRAVEKKGPKKQSAILPPRTLVTVELSKAFDITGPEVKSQVRGHLEAELGAPNIAGPILTAEIHTLGGSVEILSRRYQIDQGQVSMSGEIPPNPLLNVTISRKFEDTTVFIDVTGTARKPRISFRSDPATYSQSQIIGMVLSGTAGGGTMQQQALGALSGLIVGQLKSKLGKALPVDVIKFDVSGTDSSGANQSSLEIGKYLRDNLYLSFMYRFANPGTILHPLNNEQASLEWNFLPDYQINLMGGDQGIGSLNLYWHKRF